MCASWSRWPTRRSAGRSSGSRGPAAWLDVASLAAPSFVEACLRRPAHKLELGGVDFAVVPDRGSHPTPSGNDTFRGHFGSLAPVAIMPADGAPHGRWPGAVTTPLGPGDRVAVLGTVAELQRAGIDHRTAAGIGPSSVGFFRQLGRRIAIASTTSSKALPLVVGGLVALLVVSTLVLHATYIDPSTGGHLSLLASLYFTVETVATVGFGDYSFAHHSAAMEIYAIVLILVGVTLVSTAFRAVHEHLGQPPDRAVARSPAGCRAWRGT